MIKRLLPVLSVFGGLVLFAAGCGSAPETAPTSNANENTVEQSVTVASGTDQIAPVVTSTEQAPAASSTTMTQPEILAFPGVLPAAQVNKKILIHTNKGDIVIQLSESLGPKAASNFIYLVQHQFYDGTIFHRVIPGFMIQGGDPTGTGRGGPGYEFANDPVAANADASQTSYKDGVVAMANAGRDTNGSQFFIMVADYGLKPDYSIFGKVVSGLEVAHAIAKVQRDQDDRPLEDVKMLSVTVEK